MKSNYCSNCGAKISEGSKFCGNCGTKISITTASIENKTKYCPNCSYTSEDDEKYCPECGSELVNTIDDISVSDDISTQYSETYMNTYSEYLEEEKPKAKEIVNKKTTRRKRQRKLSKYDINEKKKKSGFFRMVGKTMLWLIAILFVGSIILYNLDDEREDNSINKVTTHNITKIPEPKSLKKAADKMEDAFRKADTTQLKLLLTETSFKTYMDVYPQIQPYMTEYAKAFKNRKLIKLNAIFALYSFEDKERNTFTVEFASTEDKKWKLTRF